MNTPKKIFSRVFQGVMHVLIPVLPYREPKILNGLDKIPELLKENGISKVMLVTDKGIRGLGLTASLEKDLEESGIVCHVYDKTVPNPTSENVEEALEMYKSNGCEALIAFGGGSSMDCAKVVGARAVCPNKPLNKMAGLLRICKKLPLLIAVPTTAGTGSGPITTFSFLLDINHQHIFYQNIEKQSSIFLHLTALLLLFQRNTILRLLYQQHHRLYLLCFRKSNHWTP